MSPNTWRRLGGHLDLNPNMYGYINALESTSFKSLSPIGHIYMQCVCQSYKKNQNLSYLISNDGVSNVRIQERLPMQVSQSKCNAPSHQNASDSIRLYPELPHQPFLSAPTPPSPAPKSPAQIQKGKPKGKILLRRTRLKRPDHKGAAVKPAIKLISPTRT